MGIDASMREYGVRVEIKRLTDATPVAVAAPGRAFGGVGAPVWDFDAAVQYVKDLSRTLPVGTVVLIGLEIRAGKP